MRKINPKCSDIDSLKYQISLHYYDISFHPDRISKLKPNEDKYNFSNTIPIEFETNNSNISLTIFDKNNKKIHTSKNNSTNKAKVIQLKSNRDAEAKSLKNKFIKSDTLSKDF